MFLVGGIERIFAIGVQISLSVLVFYAVFGARKRWLYPAAILLHALVDLPAMLFQLGIIKSIAVVEAATCACCIVLILLARIVHKRFASGSALITGQGDAAQANPEEQQ
jgi:uncharacterized membrane protein YhfC